MVDRVRNALHDSQAGCLPWITSRDGSGFLGVCVLWVMVARCLAAPDVGRAGAMIGGQGSGSTGVAPAQYHHRVVARHTHDPDAFTQGLVFQAGRLYESTGLWGASSLRELDPETGRVLRRLGLEETVFGEGLTVAGDRLVQLTWKAGRALVYDPGRLHQVGEFRFEGQGWGIATLRGRMLISDGSSMLKIMDPQGHRVVATLQVRDRGRPVDGLNELENVNGLVYANVWPTDRIAQIDPADGRVVGWLDLSGLFPQAQRPNRAAVANGIAYDATHGRLFVTGKLWPHMFEIEPVPVGPLYGQDP